MFVSPKTVFTQMKSAISIISISSSLAETLQQNMPKWKKVLIFLCGVSGPGENTKVEQEEQTEHLIEVSSLHQTRREKQILYSNLILVCLVAIFLFIFYSVPDGGPTAPTIEYGSMSGRNSTQ